MRRTGRAGSGNRSRVIIRRACARSGQVVVVNYAGNAADAWWDRIGNAVARLENLTVLDLAPADAEALTGLLDRSMRLTAMIQDGELQLMSDHLNVALVPRVRKAAR